MMNVLFSNNNENKKTKFKHIPPFLFSRLLFLQHAIARISFLFYILSGTKRSLNTWTKKEKYSKPAKWLKKNKSKP